MLPGLANVAQTAINGLFGNIEIFKIGDILVDVISSENGSDEMNITTHPVQAGFEITTAAIKVPTEKTLSIALFGPEFSATALLEATLSGNIGSFLMTSEEKKEQLYQYLNDREIVDVVSVGGTYESMLIQSITPVYEANEAYDCFVADIRIRKYEIYDTNLSNATDIAKDQFAKKKNVGVL